MTEQKPVHRKNEPKLHLVSYMLCRCLVRLTLSKLEHKEQVVTLQLFTVEFCTDRPLLPISVDVEAKGADKLRHVFLNNGKRLSRHQMAQGAHAPLLLI